MRVWLFGRVRFQAGEGPVTEIKPERAQRLLAYLALEARGEPRPRGKIAGVLWPGTDQQRTKNSLVHALRELRKSLGPAYAEVVLDDGDRLGLGADVWVDAIAFADRATADPKAALALSDRAFLEYVVRSGATWDHQRRAGFETAREELRERFSEAEPGAPEPSTPDAAVSTPRRRRLLPVLAALAALVVIVVVGVLTLGRDDAVLAGEDGCGPGVATPDPADARVATVTDTPGEPEVLGQVLAGIRPAVLATGREGIWVGERRGLGLINPRGPEPTTVPVIRVAEQPGGPSAVFDIALAKERVWVTRRDGYVVAVDRDTRQAIGEPVQYGAGAADIALAGGYVWVNNFEDEYDGSVTRIDPCSGELARFPAGRSASVVYAAFGSVWVSNPVDQSVERLNPATGEKLASVRGVEDPQDMIRVGEELWINEYTARSVQRIDPRSNAAIGEPIPIGPDPAGLAVGEEAVWVPLYGNGTLTRIDRETLTSEVGIVAAGQSPTDAAAGFGRLWAPNNDGDTVTMVGLE